MRKDMSNLSETEKIVMKLRNKRRNRKSKFQGTKINPSRLHKSQIKFFLMVLPMLIVTSLPLIFIFSHAFKPLDQLYAYPPKIFASRLTLDNFQNLFTLASQTGVPFSRYLFNSLLVSALVIFFTVTLGSLAAFAFSFLNFKGKKTLFLINQIAIIIVPVAIAVPRFIVMNSLGITNTLFAHVIPLIAMPVGVFLMKQFMDQVPVELFEASKIDGATNFQIYLKIVMPLIKPALATVMILSFQNAWNNVQTSNLYVNDEAIKTLPYYFQALTIGTNAIAAQGMAAAASLIIFVPNVVLFIILQNSVMNTMAHSGIK